MMMMMIIIIIIIIIIVISSKSNELAQSVMIVTYAVEVGTPYEYLPRHRVP
jgi:hypothetical protein